MFIILRTCHYGVYCMIGKVFTNKLHNMILNRLPAGFPLSYNLEIRGLGFLVLKTFCQLSVFSSYTSITSVMRCISDTGLTCQTT